MIVTCVLNDPAALADHQRSRASAFETAYPLTPGRQYAVVGMSITETVFYLLVEDDRGQARFAPAGMFDLVEGQGHFSALVEGEPQAVAVFARQIAEAWERGV
jgi:hypothetical protein